VKAGSEEVEMARASYKMPAMIPLVLVLLCSTGLGAGLNGITVTKAPEGTQVILACDSPTPFKHYKLGDGSRIFIECTGLTSNIKGENYPGINRGGIVGISVSSFKQADFTRISIKTDKPVEYNAVGKGSEIVVTLKTGTRPAFSPWHAHKAEAVVYKPPKEQVKPAAAQASVAKSVEAKKGPTVLTGTGGSRLISMDLEGADLLTVLRALAEYSGRNIVAGKGVSGKVTVSLRDVPWLTALKTILTANGLDYVTENGIIRVATPNEIAKMREEEEKAAPLVDKVYKIEFAMCDEIASVVNKSLSKRGHLETDVRTNSLVVSDIASNHQNLARLIAVLDSPTPQVEIQVQVVDMNYSMSRELGIDWTVTGIESRTYNVGGELELQQVFGPPQVRVGTIRDFAQINANLRLWETNNMAKVVASPRVTAVNNREASILAGQKFTIVALDQRGNPITQLYTVGTVLRATPHINSLDEITMDIHAELSEVNEASVLARAPIITTSEADTRQLVKDGETLVLGGFLQDQISESETGIPLLKDIPLLGRLFKSTSKITERREILFFITPHIIKRFE
jgi:type IV pilus assembly protein PilQ